MQLKNFPENVLLDLAAESFAKRSDLQGEKALRSYSKGYADGFKKCLDLMALAFEKGASESKPQLCEHGHPYRSRCRECDDYRADQLRAEQKDEKYEKGDENGEPDVEEGR